MNNVLLRNAVRCALLGIAAAGAQAQAQSQSQSQAQAQAQESSAARQVAASDGEARVAEAADNVRSDAPRGDGSIEEVVVTARQRSAAEQIVEERIEQEVAVDIVGAEQISRVGDSTVSLALRRLPGVTLVGDQFVYIRGLGERYSSTTLNGANVPSPDLTRNVIPLDLFPAEIVDSLSVQKVYSPDKPAAFGGGNVDIRTRTIPEDFTAHVQASVGWNADSDEDGLSYRGDGDDKWGRDDGTRALSPEIRDAIQQYQGKLGVQDIYQSLIREGGIRTIAEAQSINRGLAASVNRDFEPTPKSLGPDYGVELGVGDSVDFAGRWKAGFLALGDYDTGWRNRERINRSAALPESDVDYTRRTTHQVSMTGSLALGLDFAEEQTLGANYMYLRNTEDDASITTGTNQNFQRANGDQLRNYRVRYEERNLEVYQFTGRHRLGSETLGLIDDFANLSWLQDLAVGWYYSKSKAKTDLPSEVTFSGQDRVDPATGDVLSTFVRPSATAAEFRYSDLDDDVESRGFSVAMPFTLGNVQLELSGGGDYYQKARAYLQTQINIGSTSALPTGALAGTPADVFADANILDPANGFALSIGGIGTESYLAGETISAGWGKFDARIGSSWRVSGGARWEDFVRVTAPINPLQFDPRIGKIALPPGQTLADAARQQDEWYPSLAVTYIRPGFWADEFQLRLGASKTVARPDLREVSAATYIDPLTEARVRGNPALLNADLTNLDLRGEWFFSGGDNFTVSLFYKDIENPIETVEGAGSDDNVSLTFVNAESAEVYGIEIEGLKGLGFLTNGGWTDAFFVSGNLTVSDSELTIGTAAGVNLTRNKRRLTQHAPYVANVQLGYDAPNGKHTASLAYSFFGERVFSAGRDGAPDSLEQPFHSLDLVYSYYPVEPLAIKLRVQNLMDEKTQIDQGDVTVLEQSIGRTFKIDATYRF